MSASFALKTGFWFAHFVYISVMIIIGLYSFPLNALHLGELLIS